MNTESNVSSQTDFGLWTPDQKQVTKEKVPSRILCCAWCADGTLLALGMLSGLVSVRNQQAEEVIRFERKAPIWCMAFIPDFAPPVKPAPGAAAAPPADACSDALAIGCWDKTYSLYRLQGAAGKLQTEKQLKYYPCGLTYAGNTATKSSYLVRVH